MPKLIKNRCFNKPLSPNGSTPDGWTRDQNTPSWGGPTWQSGVWRAVEGGLMPSRGGRCLLIGADDTSTDTVSASLADADESFFTQQVSGLALTDAQKIEVDTIMMDYGEAPGDSQVRLQVTDGTTTVAATATLLSMTLDAVQTLSVALSTLDNSKTWTIKVGLERTATEASGSYQIPRVYFDNMRLQWNQYTTTPLRILKYSDDLIPASATTVTGTTPSSGYALANAANRRASHPVMFDATTSCYIEWDLGSAQTVNLFALIDSSLDAGDTWTLKGGSSANPSDVTYTIPINDTKNAFVEIPHVSYRYWRLTGASGTSKVWHVGEACLGKAIHMQQGFLWGANPTTNYKNVRMTTPYGAEWAYEIGSQRAYSMSFNSMDQETLDDIKDIYDDASGATYPVVLVPQPDLYGVYYGTLTSSYSEIERYVQVGTPGSIQFLEQARAVVQS